MQTLPLNVISIDRGVPLKNCMFTLSCEKPLNTKKNQDDLDLLILSSTTQLDNKVSNNLSKISPYLPSVSLLSSIHSYKKENNLHIYEIHPMEYITIETPQMLNEKIYSTYKIIDFSNKYPDKNNIDDLKSLILFLLSSSEHYNPETEMLIQEAPSVDDVCNIIITLTTTDLFDLYVYQQTTDERQRFKECIEILMRNAPVFSLSMKDINYLSQKKEEEDNFFSSFDTDPNSSESKTSEKISDKKIFNMFLEEFANSINQDIPHSSSKQRFDPLALPSKVKKRYLKEQKRLKRLPPNSLEYQTQLDYIELIEEFPWKNNILTKVNLKDISNSLDTTHQGLEEVKDEILHHFALEDHLDAPYGTVMCFIGPPGTGKTSIVKSIAKATQRKIVKIALGGMSDEAEFRGHRRTYVASKPGRIVESLKQAGTLNPIILLDEVDKIGKDHRSSPVNALLELLDPEQNSEFIDRYLELPIDLSKCLFIATANYKEKIPAPLLDRLDLIDFKEYTEAEKLQIFKKYTFKNKIKDLKMQDYEITFKNCFYDEIVKFSNREAEKILLRILKGCIYKNKINPESPFDFIIKAEDIKKTKNKKQIGFT